MAKKQIYYSRTYRKLRVTPKRSLVLFLAVVIPGLLLLIFFMPEITGGFCNMVSKILQKLGLATYRGVWPNRLFQKIHYLKGTAGVPTARLCVCNGLVSLAMIFLCLVLPTRNRPVSIYLTINAGIHLASSLWFLFAGDLFPYDLEDFSQLYMIQEVGIWVTFLVMTAGVTSILGDRGLGFKLGTIGGVLIYSWVFGLVRYTLFLYLLSRYSMLYMTVMYFTFGPMFDFLYLVMFYGLFINRMVNLYDSVKGREEWEWS